MRSAYATIAAFALPALIHAATTVEVPASVPTVLVPFSTLPACAQKCGPLFDAQGSCAPTTITSTSDSCFCSYTTLQGFKTGTSGVCDSSGCDAADLTAIQTWFKNFCASSKQGTATSTLAAGAATGTATGTNTAAGSSSAATSTVVPDVSFNNNSHWLSTHWKYVVMIVVIVVGIAALWIGGCLLRRHIHKKRDAAYEMRPPVVSWNEGSAPQSGPYGDGVVEKGSRTGSLVGMPYALTPKGKSPLSKEVALNDPSMYDGRREARPTKERWVPGERT